MEFLPEQPVQNEEPSTLKIKGDEGIFLFAAQALVKYAIALEKEIEGVHQAEDIEFIHRMRVASRRVRTSLGIFEECLPGKKGGEWLSHIRKLTRALGQARDADVQLDLLVRFFNELSNPGLRAGIHRLTLRLSQQRLKMQKKVESALDDLIKSKVIEAIKTRFTPFIDAYPELSPSSAALFQIAYTNINERLNEFLTYEVYLRQPEYKDELHAMRIAAKRLRYTMEIFAPLFADNLKKPLRAIRKTQEMLGEIHDCDVWIEYLPEFEQQERVRILIFYGSARALGRLKPGLDYFLKNRVEERARIFKNFSHEWSKWRKEETWLSLRETVLMAVPSAEEPGNTLPAPPNESSTGKSSTQ